MPYDSIRNHRATLENVAEKKRIGLLNSLNTDFVSGYIHKGAEKGQALSVSAI